jgi:UDP-N-acetylmuramyl pentapeptide phosphotransferase/UDP-N-acetylglucosamine-1-phosphate transferase
MNAASVLPAAIAFVATFAAAWWFGRIAPRLGWVDGGDSGHKLGVAPMPLIGGAAIVCGLLAGWASLDVFGREAAHFVPGRALGQLLARELGPTATLLPWGGVLVAFSVGLIDDLSSNGLSARWKLAGQALSGFALGLPLFFSSMSAGSAVLVVSLLVAGAVATQNALNTFDNADGAATGLGLIALAIPAPLFAAPLAAFLPFNLARRTSLESRSRLPKSILGDAGSHVIGMLVLLTPAAWPVLVLPLVDLARLCVVRARLGHKPWVGDRRHLAHRLAALGLAPASVAAVLACIAMPTVAFAALPGGTALGIGLSLLLTAWTLRRAPAPSEEFAVASGDLAQPSGTGAGR